MSRTCPPLLALALIAALAAPAQATELAPRLLDPSLRTLTPQRGERCASTTYQAAPGGMLDVRLTGPGTGTSCCATAPATA